MKQSYYAIIPADVRYDSDLKPNEKLMYGEITALSNKHGLCFASNEYFAKLYKKTTQTISVWINDLKQHGYIHVFIFRNGYEVVKRCLSIDSTDKRLVKKNLNNLLRKKRRTSYEKSKQVVKKNLKYKNTRDKNTRLSDNNNAADEIIHQLQNLGLIFNSIVTDKVSELIHGYGAKKVLKAVKIEALHQTQPRYLITNIERDLNRNFQFKQPKHYASYSRKPIPSPKMPDWAKSGYHVKLHPTSKKMQRKIQKQLHNLYRGDKK